MGEKKKDNPGVYIIRLTKSAFNLPSGQVIYIGKGDDVDYRLKQELGITTGAATFFRSIGLLLGKAVIPGSGKNFRFYERQEVANWLSENTEAIILKCDWRKEEKRLIRKHKPPLNYTYNTKYYYPGLLELRAKAKAIAMIK